MSSRAQNYEFQEWWNKQREFLDKSDNTAFLSVEIHNPTSDPTVDKGRTRSARQLSWLWLLKFQQLASSLAWLTNGSIYLLRTANRRIAASKTDSPSDSSISSRFYRIINLILFLVILLLCFELVAYFKGWHFGPPSVESAEATVERAYAKWLYLRANYLASPLQSLTNVCVILFLIQSVDRIVSMLGCFWIKIRKLRPVAAAEYDGRENVEDYPMVLVQIPMCSEREDDDNSNTKRIKPNEGNENENSPVRAEEEPKGSGDDNPNRANSKPPEPPKDYIHVRARRGQATDSHSLAERVRREKISERMKLLQDLVPGCNKVTGKALMLDEIINYVQSLQRQVEFLSMKLASVDTRRDFNMDTLISKDIFQSSQPLPHPIFPLDSSASAIFGHQPQQNPPPHSNISIGTVTQCSVDPLDTTGLCQRVNTQLPPLDGFTPTAHQYPTFCEDDLQTIVQMGFGQNPNLEATFL